MFRPSTNVDFRLLGLTGSKEKSYSPFVSTSRPLTRIGLSMRVFQRARPPLLVRWKQIYLRTGDLPRGIWWGIVVAPVDNPKAEKVQIKGKMYRAHTSAQSLKDNLLGNQVPIWAFNLACTSDQFRSSWRSGPNHTARMRTGLSLQRMGLGRVLLLVQAPSRKPSLLSKLILAPAFCSYPATAFSQPLCPGGGTQRRCCNRRTRKPLL